MKRRRMRLTAAEARARSRKGWITRRTERTPEQRAHHRAVYNTGLRKRLLRQGQCRSCCRRREPSRRHLIECVRCAKVSAARAKRQPKRRWIPRTQMRTAA